MSSPRLRHNVVYNLVGSLAPIAITLLTVPIYIRVVGEARFGVLALLWAVFGYFGVFDFGLSRATAHRLATMRHAPLPERTRVFYTACALNIGFGLVASIIFYFSAYPLLSRFMGSFGDLRGEILSTLPLIVAFFPLGLLGGVLSGCLEANERFLELNLQQLTGSILWQTLPLAFVYFAGANLTNAVLGAVLARAVSTGWMAVTCLRWAAPAGAPAVDARHIKGLLRYGGWTTITNMVSPILTSIDQFLIGALLGPRAVAYYNVPYGLATKALIPPAAFTRALFPRLAIYDQTEAEDLSRTALLLLSGLMAAACAPAILLSGFALHLWIGEDFARSSRLVAELLFIGVWINGVSLFPYTLLQARNRPDVIAKLHALELLPFIGVLWLAIQLFGLPGAAMAWILRVAVDAAMLFRVARLGWRLLVDLIAPGSCLLLALLIAEWLRPGPAAALGWSAAISLIPLAWMFTRRGDIVMMVGRAKVSAA